VALNTETPKKKALWVPPVIRTHGCPVPTNLMVCSPNGPTPFDCFGDGSFCAPDEFSCP